MENVLRKSSLIYHYGIGGLWTNNSDETFIIKAPKDWKWEGGQRGMITEENLRKFLGVKSILFPPGAKDKQIKYIPGTVAVGRFPGWHRCKGWRTSSDGRSEPCGSMVHLFQGDSLPFCSISGCSGNRGRASTMAPVRFMMICSNGHLDDFPFHEWVHNDGSHDDHRLRYISTSYSGLAGITIQCETCSSTVHKVQMTMRGALSPETFEKRGIKCTGRSPWLNSERVECDCETLTGVQKSSSNLLFPIVRNSIFCPSEDTLPAWIKNWIETDDRRNQFRNLLPSFSYSPEPLLEIMKIFWTNFSEEKRQILASKVEDIEEYLNPSPSLDPFADNGYKGIFQREFDRFLNFPEDERLDDFTISRPPIEEYTPGFQGNIEIVGLLEKLRDTRVYTGFSRITPHRDVTEDTIRSCYGTNEVIGDIIRGEGIFLGFKGTSLQEWTERKEVKDRFEVLTTEKKEELLDHNLVDSKKDAIAYMLIHSFSHALIGEIAIFSGYNTASIRERIYVGPDGRGGKMFGLLVYTSDGDSEGSLGGLVRLGKPGVLEDILEQAIKRAIWCSSDPLCSHSIPKGSKGSNLAACHHCLLLPETSCESRNEFLDRELIVSNNNEALGFYKR